MIALSAAEREQLEQVSAHPELPAAREHEQSSAS